METPAMAALWTAYVMPSRWSLALVAAGLFGQWLVGEHRRVGWVVGVGTQALWIAYALVTHQYGFLLSAALFAAMYFRNWRRWGRVPRTVAPEPLNHGGELAA